MSAPSNAPADAASQLSFSALVAGVLAAYGAFALLISLVAGIARGADFTRTLSGGTWDHLGTTGGVLVASTLLLAWLYGGYVAGRMAGRDGYRHGVWMFVLGILGVVMVAAIVSRFTDTASVLQSLRVIGIPVRRREWKEVISVPGVASLVAMFAGAVLGAALGETSTAAPPRRVVEEEPALEPVPAREPTPALQPEPEPAEGEPEPAMTSLWDAFVAGEPEAEPGADREDVIRARDREEAARLAETDASPWMGAAQPAPARWTEPPEPAPEPEPFGEPEPFAAQVTEPEPVPFTEPEPFVAPVPQPEPFVQPVPEPEPFVQPVPEPVAADESLWGKPPPSYEPPPLIEPYPLPTPPPLMPIEELSEEEAARRRQQEEAARAYEAAREEWR